MPKNVFRALPLCWLFLQSCAKQAYDPFELAPSAPFAVWSEQEGSQLVSSKFCKTLLPQTFAKQALSLAELLDIALQNNPSTKQTWAQARAMAAQYGESLSGFYPSIEVIGSFLRQKGTSIEVGLPIFALTTQTGPDVTLSYTLFDFGQRSSAAMAAREALYFADFNHNQMIQEVLQRVMQDYYAYLYQKAQLEANVADLDAAQLSLQAANDRFAMGVAALGDVAQARTHFLQSRIQLTNQRQSVENSFARLAFDMGLPANIPFTVQEMPETIEAIPILESVEVLVQEAQEQRQDFLASLANIRAKEALVRNAKRAMLPTLDTNIDVGHYWFNGGVQDSGPHWSVAFTLQFPLFSGFLYKNQIQEAEANVVFAKAEALQTELNIVQMVTVSHKAVQTAALNVADSKEFVQAAQLDFQIALANYKAGTGTILDVLAAQSSLANARASKASAEQMWFTSLANLAYATGSLCRGKEEPSCTMP